MARKEGKSNCYTCPMQRNEKLYKFHGKTPHYLSQLVTRSRREVYKAYHGAFHQMPSILYIYRANNGAEEGTDFIYKSEWVS
jgi:hypothetical protein